MTGTLAGALAARKVRIPSDALSAEAEGIIENVDGKALLTRIKVHYTLRIPAGTRETVERALEVHEQGCPVAQSLERGIAVEWDSRVEETSG
jgi:uncharacterized OsmC-like protein